MCASTVRCPPTRPHPWGASFLIRVRAEPTRNTNNAAQPSRKSSHPHSRNRTYVHARPRPRPLNVRASAGHSPGKYSSTIPSSCARISSKRRSRSSVVALMRFPLDSVLYTPLSPQHEAWIRDIYSLVSRHDEARATPSFRSSVKNLATDILSRHSAIANTLSTRPSEPTIETPKSES